MQKSTQTTQNITFNFSNVTCFLKQKAVFYCNSVGEEFISSLWKGEKKKSSVSLMLYKSKAKEVTLYNKVPFGNYNALTNIN